MPSTRSWDLVGDDTPSSLESRRLDPSPVPGDLLLLVSVAVGMAKSRPEERSGCENVHVT